MEVTQDSRRELVATLLKEAIDAAEGGEEEELNKLELAIEGAQKLGLHAELRVAGRRVLARWRKKNPRAQCAEAEVSRLSRQLSELRLCDALKQLFYALCVLPFKREHSFVAQFPREQEMCLKQLTRAISEAELAGVEVAVVEEARHSAERVQEQRKAERSANRKLESLLSSDCNQVKEILEQKKLKICGAEARRVLTDVADHLVRQAEKEQQQSWLMQELAAAGENGDAAQLRKLMTQASSLDLCVPPSVLALVDELEAGDSTRLDFTNLTSTSTVRSHVDVSEKLAAMQARQSKLLRRAIEKAEQYPDTRILDAAQKALAEAKQTRVPLDDIAVFERRLVEEGLHKLMSQVEEVTIGAVAENVLKDIVQVHQLARLVADGMRFGVDEDLLEDAEELHERSDELQAAFGRRIRDASDLERLHLAVDECKRVGLNVHTAERQVLRLKDLQVNRESTQAELMEASRGVGVAGRLRLETAVRAAKSAGVSAEQLRAASQKLQELREHEERCDVLAGEVQRSLPLLQKQPWRYQQLLEKARALKPWTSKLERLITDGKEILDKRPGECRASGKSAAELLGPLRDLLDAAETAGLQHESIKKGKEFLQHARREACQRSVAEHRLQLALNARDQGEIERSMRQVRALGQVGLTDHRPHRPHLRGEGDSAGLMEQASSVLQSLTETTWRDASAAISEAKHCGVTRTLIEQAKLKLRLKHRKRQEQEEACKSLQKILAKKEVPKQVLLAKITKVQRLQGIQANHDEQVQHTASLERALEEQKKDHMADLERAVKETFSSFVARNDQQMKHTAALESALEDHKVKHTAALEGALEEQRKGHEAALERTLKETFWLTQGLLGFLATIRLLQEHKLKHTAALASALEEQKKDHEAALERALKENHFLMPRSV
eukprot:g6396.t1